MSELGARRAGLGPAQRALLERLMTRRETGAPAAADIPCTKTVRDIPLLPNQSGVWFQSRIFPDSPEYNQIGTLRLRSCPSEEAVRDALRTLMQRHDALRLRIYEKDGEPLQEVCEDVPCPLRWHDAGALSPGDAETRIEVIGNSCYREPFDLETAPLYRMDVVRMPGGGAVAFLVFHHIAVDGYSLETVYDDLLKLLAGEPPGPAPAVRFIDYAASQGRRARGAELDEQLSYWRSKLGGELPVLDLPSDRPRPPVPSRRGHVVPCRIPPDVLRSLKALAEAENTTLFVVLAAIYNTFLRRVSGATDVLVGTALSGRDHPAVETMVGMFVNTVVLRSDLTGNPTFRALVRQVRTTVLEAHDNGDVPFGSVVADLNLPRDQRISPLFQTMFSVGGLPSTPDGQLDTTTAFADSEAAKWDLSLFLDERDGGMGGSLEYSADLFDRPTADRFVAMFVELAAAFARDPDLKILEAPLLSEREQEHILRAFEPYARPDIPYRTLAQPFEEQVRRSPDAVALVGENGEQTYGELNAAANRLAHRLLARGAGPGTFVAVCMSVGFDLVMALLAVAKTGAAYVPLDPGLPGERIRFLLEDTAPVLVLADDGTGPLVTAASCAVHIVGEAEADGDWSADDPPCTAPAGRPVHILFTSGSTGRPKGVVYTVEAALAEILWLHGRYPLTSGGANLFKTSYGFDVSIWEIFWTLYFGARLVVPKPGENCDPKRLVALINRHDVTQIFLVPGMLELMLEVLPDGACRSLACVLCGGAPVSPRLRDRFYEKFPDALLVNCFGPTECGTVTDCPLPDTPGADYVPLGHPAANFTCYVLDPSGRLCPLGVPGELYIGGEIGLALGYHGRPALTAERFLPDPFGPPGQRMYRTGDLCRRRGDGALEHLGRIDRQVKLRGMRVELAEIEAVLCEHEAVAQCHVLVRNDPQTGPQIPAFVVLKEGAEAAPEALLDHARSLLPQHMVPPVVVIVGEIPTNVNGKIDAQALAKVGWTAARSESRERAAPETDLEKNLLQIYRDLLGQTEIGATDSFFDLGGHSLLIFKLIDACDNALNLRPSVADVFACPTVRDLAARLETGRRGQSCLVPLAVQPGRPLLVFIHGAGGSVMPFVDVAKLMGPDLSCWGLQAPGIGTDRAKCTIEALAARYVAEVDAVRGLSPVILAGWSMGGCIALEMAREWGAQNVDVAALLLLDTWTPPKLLNAQQAKEMRSLLDSLDILGLEAGAEAHQAPDATLLFELDQLIERDFQAFDSYDPRPLAVDADYLGAGAPFDANGVSVQHQFRSRGWRRIFRAVAPHTVDGNHFTMVEADKAPALAMAIQRIVDTRLVGQEI
jgi:amino acid adenylation domain-containing protein